MPSGSATQFRYTQTPSKVLHLRNMPWECTEEELVELCKPFGRVVNTMCNVGANRNQAFVEFADQNQAISMVSYYASSSEPAQVRGKTVYIQYSNRQEITNNKGTGDSSGNVLLVTFEGVQPNDISIDVIHLVFSAFGFVHKIATFEKAAGFQDLNIKFQSHRSRDYTNPYLPVNPTAIEGIAQPTLGPDGKIKEPESNVLLASIENMQYAVTVDVLHTVFSAFGTVQKIAMFEKNGGMQALIQYPDITTAAVAKQALEGHCIYDGGYCKLHLSYSRHTDLNVKAHDERSRDYTVSDPSSQMQAAAQVPGPSNPGVAWQNTAPSASFYASTAAATPVGQVPAWNPNMQAGAFGSASSAYPAQPMMPGSVPPYPGIGSSSGAPPVSFQASQQMPQYGVPPGAPHQAPPSGQAMYFPK
uniref:RRM domain-containing protein n=1 Tax=Oryza punctata TaxID=4537 RepID=A0A0E0LV73_ORYPU